MGRGHRERTPDSHWYVCEKREVNAGVQGEGMFESHRETPVRVSFADYEKRLSDKPCKET